mmetsp:Transcript_4620/g.7171  ORF Transcript_4620/g.7171 Transcript_4620/m.7171 type:complete len:377 (-) Transcript_4620:146-1276(-)
MQLTEDASWQYGVAYVKPVDPPAIFEARFDIAILKTTTSSNIGDGLSFNYGPELSKKNILVRDISRGVDFFGDGLTVSIDFSCSRDETPSIPGCPYGALNNYASLNIWWAGTKTLLHSKKVRMTDLISTPIIDSQESWVTVIVSINPFYDSGFAPVSYLQLRVYNGFKSGGNLDPIIFPYPGVPLPADFVPDKTWEFAIFASTSENSMQQRLANVNIKGPFCISIPDLPPTNSPTVSRTQTPYVTQPSSTPTPLSYPSPTRSSAPRVVPTFLRLRPSSPVRTPLLMSSIQQSSEVSTTVPIVVGAVVGMVIVAFGIGGALLYRRHRRISHTHTQHRVRSLITRASQRNGNSIIVEAQETNSYGTTMDTAELLNVVI